MGRDNVTVAPDHYACGAARRDGGEPGEATAAEQTQSTLGTASTVPPATRDELLDIHRPETGRLERPPTVPPLRIAFASDLHLGPTTSSRTLDRAFELLADAEPDVLLLGGDFVFLDATREKARELVRLARGGGARTTLAVLGNHDLWSTHGHIEDALTRSGARILVNESQRLPPPHASIAT